VSVREGDLVVLTSDGFSDNIFPSQLLQEAEKHFRAGNISLLAKQLATIATARAL
jgi:hypothetical protein